VVSTKVGRLLAPSPETARRTDTEGFAVPAELWPALASAGLVDERR
jgi:hypothetical protein